MLDPRPAASAAFIHVALLLLWTSLLLPAPAVAHSWYPAYCCNERDCMKVDRIEYVSGGMVMIVGGMRVFVPESMDKQPSQDTDAHVCVSRAQGGGWNARCVFMPGTARAPVLRQLAAR